LFYGAVPDQPTKQNQHNGRQDQPPRSPPKGKQEQPLKKQKGRQERPSIKPIKQQQKDFQEFLSKVCSVAIS
jgi:hypothetical protein